MTNHDPTAERVARNDSIFREANEKIGDAVARFGVDGRLPFICECADPACTEIVHLDPARYEQIRANPILFLNARGHNTAGGPYAAVVERGDGYEVIEKRGPAREIAGDLDPRS